LVKSIFTMPTISRKNIASVDLNLLVAFEALLEERSVTRAGQRIGLAQPSMSTALNRLRALFNDPLFQRGPAGMVPTARALALSGAVWEALRHVRLALDHGSVFDPTISRHVFRLGVTDYGAAVIVPELIRSLRAQAPGIDLQIRPIGEARSMMKQLEDGYVDALLGGHLPMPRNGLRHRLFDERFVCICDAAHAARYGSLDLEGYAALPHALFAASGGDGMPAALDDLLAQHGLRRRVALTLPHALALPFAIAGTDLVAALAERVARRMTPLAGIALLPLPGTVPPFAIDMICTRESMDQEQVRWLISRLVLVGERLGRETLSPGSCSESEHPDA